MSKDKDGCACIGCLTRAYERSNGALPKSDAQKTANELLNIVHNVYNKTTDGFKADPGFHAAMMYMAAFFLREAPLPAYLTDTAFNHSLLGALHRSWELCREQIDRLDPRPTLKDILQ